MPANATSFFRFWQRRLGGARYDGAVGLEAGAVARAVPRAFGLIPVDEAAHVRADGGPSSRGAGFVAIDRHVLSVQFQDASRAAAHRPHRPSFGARHTIANQVIGIVLVL